MSYQIDSKTGQITIGGWEKGIATSPHNGIANIQAGNLSTEIDEIMCNFNRVQQSQTNTTATGTLAFSDTSHLGVTSGTLVKGVWITVTGSTHTGELANANYYVLPTAGGGFVLATTYNGSGIGGYTAGLTASFTIIRNISKPIARATEPYSDGSNQQYRYYILDSAGLVWVYDTANDTTVTGVWTLPDTDITTPAGATGIEVLNGWLMLFAGSAILCKPTVLLGGTPGWQTFASGQMMSSTAPHFAFTGHQGKTYYTDDNFIGSIFPNSALAPGTVSTNIQSYASYTASTTTGTIGVLIDGSLPTNGISSSVRIPAFFFSGGTKPTAITVGTIYYIAYNSPTAGHFEVYAAASGGAAIDIATGSSGTQYFNTFYPVSASGKTTITFTPQKLNLPFFETSQFIGEIGNNVIIGCKSNVLYPWNQIDPTPGDLIPLPEANVVTGITVNNMLYIFAGNKGNIYVTNGSTASFVISVPDYCAGIAGTQSSYFEPYFQWGDAMYCRGRVWFSILDQVASTSSFPAKAGNCGGIWSFVPTQNFFIGQDTGLSLRTENRSSYGTYNGYSSVLIPAQNQLGRAPQYWNGWQSTVTSPTYGIDGTDTTASTPCVIETDLIPTGTLLDKKTYERIEYKLSAPLTSSESVAISYRQDATSAWTSCGTVVKESNTELSGYFPINFEKGQWLQLQITLTPNGSQGSYVRLKQILVI